MGGIIGDKTGRRNAFILYEAIHIVSMVVGAFTEYGFPYCLPFCDVALAGSLLVTLFVGFTRIYARRNRGTAVVQSGFLYW